MEAAEEIAAAGSQQPEPPAMPAPLAERDRVLMVTVCSQIRRKRATWW
jgi:hypothetical protein